MPTTSLKPRGPWLTTAEAAELLGVSPATLTRWCARGCAPATLFAARWGKARWRFNRKLLERYIAGQLGIAS